MISQYQINSESQKIIFLIKSFNYNHVVIKLLWAAMIKLLKMKSLHQSLIMALIGIMVRIMICSKSYESLYYDASIQTNFVAFGCI